MDATKQWWASRTIWTGLLTSIFAILTGLHKLPSWLDNSSIDTMVTASLGIATIIFRAVAKKAIAPVETATPPTAA